MAEFKITQETITGEAGYSVAAKNAGFDDGDNIGIIDAGTLDGLLFNADEVRFGSSNTATYTQTFAASTVFSVNNSGDFITMDNKINMNSHKITNLAAGGANGEAIRWEQLVDLRDGIANGSGSIAENSSNVSTNSYNVSVNSSDIAENSSNVSTNSYDVSVNSSDIAENSSNVSTNSYDVSVNSSDIAENSSNVSTNSYDVSVNSSDIAENSSNVSTNSYDVSVNSSDIAENSSNVSTNSYDVSVNSSDIAENSSNVSTNSYNISVNSSDIAENSSNVSTNSYNHFIVNSSDIAENSSNVSTNSYNIYSLVNAAVDVDETNMYSWNGTGTTPAPGSLTTADNLTISSGLNSTIYVNCAYINQLAANNIGANTIGVTGSITAQNVECTSDKRFKENILNLESEDEFEKLTQVRNVTYKFKEGDGKTKYGVIAQEVHKIFPEIVNTENDDKWTVDYNQIGSLLPLLCRRVKALGNRIKELEDLTQ